MRRAPWLALWLSISAGLGGACKFPELPAIDDGADPDAASAVDASTDGAPGPLGGDALAQLAFATAAYEATAAAAPGGGIVVALRYQHSAPLTIGGMTIPCTGCQVLFKLTADLDQLEWYAYGNEFSRGELATSPAGDLYWLLEAPGDGSYTATLRGSAFAAPIAVSVPGNAQGEDVGGAKVVVALSSSGAARWAHVLGQSDPTIGNAMDFGAFGAADGAIFTALTYVRGTLTYTDSAGLGASRVVPAGSYVIHELDPATGRTVQVGVRPHNTSGDRYRRLVGISGYGGKGFIAQRDTHDAAGTATAHALSIGELSNGAFLPWVNYALITPAGSLNDVVPGRYKNQVLARTTVASSLTIGSTPYNAPSTNGDAYFFVLDGVSATVRAATAFGGTAHDVPKQMVDVGNDDVYCLGEYTSADLTIGGTELPDATDATAPAIFATRARVDRDTMSLQPVWAAGFSGTRRLILSDAVADKISGDLYLLGTLSPGGTVSFGLGAIDSTTTGTAFVVRIRRGA